MNCFTGLIGTLSVIGLALSSFAQGAPAPDATPMSLTAKLEKEQVVISAGGKLFTVYKFTGSQKYPYFWPVNGPASGRSVTVETSEPFPHHRSLFFGCDRVNRGNYWQDTNERGQIVSQGPKIIEALGERVVFTDECLWRQPGKDPIIRDLRRIVVTAPNEKLRLIDFEITLEPLVDVRIDKTNHSLFSARVMPDLSVISGGTLINAGGKTGEKGTWGTSSPWCDYFGEREGQIEGIAIFQNPDNRWFPSKWFTRDYGFFSPTPMFWPEGSYTALPKGKALTLRYRVVVHAGDVKGAGIANLYEQYAASGAAERLDQLLGKLKTYESGQSRGPLLLIGKLIRECHGSPQQRKAIEERLSAVLQTDATRACKHFICLQLSEIGTGRSVPVLATLLKDEELSDMARFALQRIPSPKVDQVFREALKDLSSDIRIGIINSIAWRGDRKAVPELARLAGQDNRSLSGAAISALGHIGGNGAAEALTALSVPQALNTLKTDALLQCADQLQAADEIAAATAIYRKMVAKGNPAHVRIAALKGIVRTEKEKALPTVLSFLEEGDLASQLVAAKLAREVPGKAATEALTAQLPALSPNAQVVLLAALSARGDKTAAPAVTTAARNANEDVRTAAVQALGILGDATSVELLAKAAAAGGRIGQVAADSLRVLGGENVDAAMAKVMKKSETAERIALILCLAARNYSAVIPQLLDGLNDFGPDTHKAACKALGSLAGQKDLARMVASQVGAGDPSKRMNLGEAIARVGSRIKDTDACAAPVIAALAKAGDEAVIDLLPVLNRIGGDKSLAAIRGLLASENASVKKAAIRALADWPGPAPMSDLLEIARSDPDQVHQILALRGYIKQATMPADRTPEETVKMLEQAMALAKMPAEKKAILSLLPGYSCEEARALAEAYLNDEAVAAEAKLAVGRLSRESGQKFDFQLKGSPVMEGFTEVNQSTRYSDRLGHGWLTAPDQERNRNAGTDLTRDFIFDRAPRTFRVKVPNGSYVVTVFLGDMSNPHDNMAVHAEGKPKLKKVTSGAGEVKELAFNVDVEDGALDIEFKDAGGRDVNWTCAGVIVGK